MAAICHEESILSRELSECVIVEKTGVANEINITALPAELAGQDGVG